LEKYGFAETLIMHEDKNQERQSARSRTAGRILRMRRLVACFNRLRSRKRLKNLKLQIKIYPLFIL